jgi:small subunit ribosomal protein S1
MNVQNNARPGLDENYWQAILDQGEMSAEPTEPESPELWAGLQEHFAGPHPEYATAHQEADGDNGWAQARMCLEADEILEIEVTGYNRGGLLVNWHSLNGFVPASHLVGLSPYLDEEERRQELERRVGQYLKLKVIELDSEEERFILSERVTTDEEKRRVELLSQMQPGEVKEGVVTNLCSFGAFIDLGGVEGLVHISELSWGRVDHPRDVLKRGQEVQVYVLNVDPAEGRIGLSLKRLQPDPWETVEQRYQTGQLVQGTVTNVVNFGAFARIEEGLEGLIHVSELAEGNFLHPRNVVQEGESVIARVLSIDSRRRRMALSLRQVGQEEKEKVTARQDQVDVWVASSATANIYRP